MRIVALLVVLIAAAPAFAQKSRANELVKQAKTHFELQEYGEAETELKEAYKLDPRPEIMYALAQAQRMNGECDKAIVSYKNFLRSNPPDAQKKLAEDNITTCSAKPKEGPRSSDSGPRPEEKPVPPKPEPPPPLAEDRRPKTEDRSLKTEGRGPRPEARGPNWPGRLLVAGGIVAAGVGTYLALHGQSTIDNIDNAKYYDDFVTRSKDASSAKTERTLGLAGAGIGGAMIVGGLLTYMLRSPDREAPIVSIHPHGAAVAWSF